MAMTAVTAIVLGLVIGLDIIRQRLHLVGVMSGLVFAQMIGSRTPEGFMHIRQRHNRLKQGQQ